MSDASSMYHKRAMLNHFLDRLISFFTTLAITDFTFYKYSFLCSAIKESDLKTYTVKDYLIEKPKKGFVILRHDIDDNPEVALNMANLELHFGLRSTYYFRDTRKCFQKEIMKKIARLGFEIGYHYEPTGKLETDSKIFANALKKFKTSEINIQTVCAHGSFKEIDLILLSKYSDIFKNMGVKGEAYADVGFNKLDYYSDSGRIWRHISRTGEIKLTNTNRIVDHILRKGVAKIYILVHPQWWSINIPIWFLKQLSGAISTFIRVIFAQLTTNNKRP